MNYPKISIITPSFNQAEYLEQTILSVIDQNYPNLEYIIIDGGSTDGSVEIIKKYESKLSYWISEKDNGLYEALNKGFQKSTGEIMGWLNSDDMLHKKALFSIAEILSLNSVEWIQGQETHFDERGRTVEIAAKKRWSKYRYFMKDYKWIQQESTFWSRALWNKAGGYISTRFKYAGDLELWNRFFKHEKLFTSSCLIGGFRYRTKDQLTVEGLDKYFIEAESILNENKLSNSELNVIKKIRTISNYLEYFNRINWFFIPYLISNLQKKRERLYDFPPEIYFSREKQSFLIQ